MSYRLLNTVFLKECNRIEGPEEENIVGFHSHEWKYSGSVRLPHESSVKRRYYICEKCNNYMYLKFRIRDPAVKLKPVKYDDFGWRQFDINKSCDLMVMQKALE